MMLKKIIFILTLKRFVFQSRKKIIFSPLNQSWNLMLKQGWFWVDTELNLYLRYDAQEFISLCQRWKQNVFQRWHKIILSTLSQCRNLTLKQQWFWVDTKTNFVPMLYPKDIAGLINVENMSTHQSQQISTSFRPAFSM